ncbi:MAG: sigma-70 family RNA polymerase sigma factor [Planctomycetota bacterium]
MESPRPTLSTEEWSRHVQALRVLAAELVGGAEEREDLVQGALAAALERPPRVLSWTWLAQVVRNRARDRGRRRGRRPGEARVEDAREPIASEDDTSEVVARLELHDELNRELRALSEPYRTTLYRRYFEGLTPLAIAAHDGVPVKTVKTRLERGLAQLRERLARRHGPDLRAFALLLRPASPPVPVPPPLLTGPLGGSLLMAKKLAFVALALLVVFGAWFVVRPASGARGREPDGDGAAALVLPDVPGAPAPSFPAQTAREEPRGVAPEAAPVEPAREGRLRVKVRWHDGTPAAGVRVHLRRWHAELRVPSTPLAAATSDAAGLVLFEALAPGALHVSADRTQDVLATEVGAGEERELVLDLPAGLHVRGTVRTRDGRPLAGAEVWLLARWMPYDWHGMSCVARSDALGHFELRDAPLERGLGATAAGHAPSRIVTLERGHGEEPLELVLEPEGAALAGRVVDEAGLAVAGAAVCFGGLGFDLSYKAPGLERAWAPRATETDSEGHFVLAGLTPEARTLEVRARGFAPWSGTVAPGATFDECVVRLAPAASVVGTVRDAAGQPVAHASVRAFAQALAPRYLLQGQYDDPSVFGSPFTLADELGRYRLEGVPIGTAHLYASPPRREADFMRTEFHAEATLETRAGETLTWDPVLAPGHHLSGRVLYSDGEPMGDTFVQCLAVGAPEGERLTVFTDKEGRFALYNLTFEAHSLSVQLNAPPPDAQPLGLDSVWPDGPELELVASFPGASEHGQGRVTGELVDPHGRVRFELGAGLSSERGITYLSSLSADGRFEFTELPAGRYRPAAFDGDELVFEGDWFTLDGLEARDVGRLEVPPGVTLTLRLTRAESLRAAEVQAYLALAGTSMGSFLRFEQGDELVLERSPGRYELRLWSAGSAQVLRRFELDGPRTLELALVPGVWRPVDIEWPASDAGATLHLTVTDAQGSVWEDSDISLRNTTSPFKSGALVPPGHYVLRARTDTGLSGEIEFAFEALDEPAPALRIELR